VRPQQEGKHAAQNRKCLGSAIDKRTCPGALRWRRPNVCVVLVLRAKELPVETMQTAQMTCVPSIEVGRMTAESVGLAALTERMWGHA
jgi:hypothetical protein